MRGFPTERERKVNIYSASLCHNIFLFDPTVALLLRGSESIMEQQCVTENHFITFQPSRGVRRCGEP